MGCGCIYSFFVFKQIPRYCQVEGWEYEQILKIALNKVENFHKCSISIEFDTKLLKTENATIDADMSSVLSKYASLKKYSYPSPWNGELCEEKNRTVLCNLGLLCLCPIEVIPVIYHVQFGVRVEHQHIYYQCHIVLFSSLSESHPFIKNILELIKGSIVSFVSWKYDKEETNFVNGISPLIKNSTKEVDFGYAFESNQ